MDFNTLKRVMIDDHSIEAGGMYLLVTKVQVYYKKI